MAVNEQLRDIEDGLSDGRVFAPKVSVGINTGEVISGNVGSATLRRFDFTAMGDVVNTAQRLQARALPGQILISENTRQQLNGAFRCEYIGEFQLRNKG